MTAPTYLNTRTADMPTTEQLLREACTLLHNVNATFVPSNDSANAMCVSLCQRITALIAELRAAAQQSALDELVRENERLGLYDDQKPAQETKCACSPDMYVAGYTGGAAPEGLFGKLYVYIEGASRSVEYAPVAAPAPAQPVTDAQPVAWRYRDYVSGCWFVSAEPYPAGSIAGESVPLYLAPSPAQPRQPLSDGEADAILRRVGVLANAHSEFLREIVRATERAITGDKP